MLLLCGLLVAQVWRWLCQEFGQFVNVCMCLCVCVWCVGVCGVCRIRSMCIRSGIGSVDATGVWPVCVCVCVCYMHVCVCVCVCLECVYCVEVCWWCVGEDSSWCGCVCVCGDGVACGVVCVCVCGWRWCSLWSGGVVCVCVCGWRWCSLWSGVCMCVWVEMVWSAEGCVRGGVECVGLW